MPKEATLYSRYDNSYALIVGINSYDDPRFVPLGEAEDDAQRLNEVLSSPPHNFRVRCMMGQAATKNAILQSMHDLRDTGVNDRILVYFACHGYTLQDKFGNETGYLAMVDTVPDMDFTALHLEEVINLRRYANAKHITFVFDACFSGQALGLTRAQSVAAQKYLTRRAYQVISAGAGDETVADFNSMTDFMVEALEGPMDSPDGVYTASKLGQHLRDTMAADSGQMQIPQFGHLRGSQGGDFVFHVNETAVLPPDILKAIGSSNIHLRYGGVAALIELVDNSPSDSPVTEVAINKLEAIRETDPDERIVACVDQFFKMEEARILGDSGELTLDEVQLLVDTARAQMEQTTRDVVEESAGSVSIDDLLSLVGEVQAPATNRLEPRLHRTPQPEGRLDHWASVKTRIEDVLESLEDEDTIKEATNPHEAPTQARYSRVEDLEDMIRRAVTNKRQSQSDDGWDDREEWQR